jgi:hypothetical protein
MKTLLLFLIGLFFLGSTYSQEKGKSAPEVDKKCKILVDKLNEYLISDELRKIKEDLSTTEYGKYVGEQLIAMGLVIDFSVDDLVMACCYNHDCIGASDLEVTAYIAGPKFPKYEKFMPVLEGDIQYIEPQTDLYKIKCCKPAGKIKIGDKLTDISCKEYMEYNHALMSVIAKHIQCNYSSWQDGDLAYTAISKY